MGLGLSSVAEIDWQQLEQTALQVQKNAYAPYSGYAVGAALLVRSGRIFAGCNVENVTFGLTVCAERSTLLHMVAEGEREPVALAVVTRGPLAAAPCGLCRQALTEFAEDLPIRLLVADRSVPPRMTSLSLLLPEAFRPGALLDVSRP